MASYTSSAVFIDLRTTKAMRSVTQSRFSRARAARERAALARQVDLLHRRSSVRICFCVIARVATTTSGKRSAVSARSRSDQRIVQMMSRANPAAAATRVTRVATPRRPGSVNANGPICDDASPGREPGERRRQRDEERQQPGREPDLAHEREHRHARGRGEDDGHGDQREQRPDGVHEARDDGEEHERRELDARVQALQQAVPGGELLVLAGRR